VGECRLTLSEVIVEQHQLMAAFDDAEKWSKDHNASALEKTQYAAGPLVETGLRVSATQPIYRGAYVSAYVEGLFSPLSWGVTLDHSVVWTSPHFAEAIGLDVGLRFE
jgi:hypothetical protein